LTGALDDLTPRRTAVLTALACAVATTVPFLVVTIPPIADLPQHVAQIRLLGDHLRDPASSPYIVQWLTPYGLGYAVLGGCWILFPPLVAGRAAFAILAVTTTLAIHAVARRRCRPLAAAVLATLPFFSHPLYWGFYNFLWGWPVFLAWFQLTGRDDVALSRKRGAALIACGLGLYFAHILWLLAAIAWTVAAAFVLRAPWRRLAERALGLTPAAIMAIAWFMSFRDTSFGQGSSDYESDFLRRASPARLVDAAFGGLAGPLEPIAGGLILVWILAGLAQHRGRLRAATDGRLLLLGGGLAFGYLALPILTANTIYFNTRWMPMATVALVLAAPAPRPEALARAVAAAALAAFMALTALAWRSVETTELTGLEEALAAVPDSPRILGLNYASKSHIVSVKMFLHQVVWAQVLHGGIVGFSFAQYAPSLVIFDPERWQPRWAPMLEWYPTRARAFDLAMFDFVLVNASPRIHDAFGALPGIERASTGSGRFRLYRIDRQRIQELPAQGPLPIK
jgi:hypothetical protein